ncbi:cryptochrome/photolyase family protein [Micromonospora sp. NPDC048830]|uniref:cryptochrome/photolyase family protein n=1 Tax=Micromonospora sp. NPDC048830 TaxID=3364257 RepID=UPI00371D234A
MRCGWEAFYRFARQHHQVLVEGDEPVGGRWSLDPENRQPPPKEGRLDVPPPPMPKEDDIDAEVRAGLDRWEREGVRFVGRDGPRRCPATGREAKARLRHFLKHRLASFGPYEDAMLSTDPWLAHSMLSSSSWNASPTSPRSSRRRGSAAATRRDESRQAQTPDAGLRPRPVARRRPAPWRAAGRTAGRTPDR